MVMKRKYCLTEKQMQQMKRYLFDFDRRASWQIEYRWWILSKVDPTWLQLMPSLALNVEEKKKIFQLSESIFRGTLLVYTFQCWWTEYMFWIKNQPQRTSILAKVSYKSNILFQTQFYVQFTPSIFTHIRE